MVLRGVAKGAAFCGILGLGCLEPTGPHQTSAHDGVVPGHVLRGVSLFGTDEMGLPMGTFLTATAAPGSRLLYLAPAPGVLLGGAVTTALSPDGETFALLTSGYNRLDAPGGEGPSSRSGESVFFYDVSGGAARQVQVLTIPNSFVGLAFAGSERLYASGGPDDLVHELARNGGTWTETLPAIPLGHLQPRGLGGLGIDQGPYAGGLAVTRSGARLVVANHENDTVSVIDTEARRVVFELPLRPGGGVPGGEFPLGVAIAGDTRAFVSCQRDREVVELDLGSRAIVRRIRVGGQPVALLLNRAQSRLYVANANSDSVSVVDVSSGRVRSEVPVEPSTAGVPGPGPALRGSNPNAVALSPDERTLYVTEGGTNAVAVIALSDGDAGGPGDAGAAPVEPSRLLGLIPTGFYPTAVTVSTDGGMLYVGYGKSPMGPNPGGPWSNRARASREPYAAGVANQFTLQLTHGGLLTIPTPPVGSLGKLTRQVLRNNRMDGPARIPPVFVALRGAVKHVIYIIGENRTYDQILGDLDGADGDPHLTHWGQAITPNHHALARAFVTLDRFFDAGGVSGDGWQWTTAARTTDVAEKEIPLEYADRGLHSYDWEGGNRNINVGLSTVAERVAANPHTPSSPDLLPGTADVAAVDGPAEGGRGYLWDAAMAAGLSVRNYGVFVDDSRYGFASDDAADLPAVREPAATKTRVAFATRASLQAVTDPYYRGFDMKLADYWREKEWEREFDGYVARGDMPALQMVRLPHDHLGKFGEALDGVDTPDTQIADHDYALGLLVEKVSRSPFWRDTVVVALEDDAQNGADHVDAQRSFVLFAGGHVRRGAIVSTVYSTPSVLRTIELLLGIGPLAQQDAFAAPMEDVVSPEVDARPYRAIVPAVLRATALPLPPSQEAAAAPRGSRSDWSQATLGYDFDHADAAPSSRFNEELYCALVSDAPCASEPPKSACMRYEGVEVGD